MDKDKANIAFCAHSSNSP